ncbi:uncharacterized protein LOC117815098 [Notolabrus celidotus]|uniref:uncharacterized protein LOC117815098 n=1 Tax=Notolabrus celidotus TaxID=1203425 RepID=UPI001490362D|nr:uncharacterized protein LOC117815098 [Notolabrus celidotus]
MFILLSFIMTGYLLLVFLMYSFPQLKAQVVLPPTLTVNPSVITETDSVTLNCQPPPSLSVSECYFRFIREQPAMMSPCVKTMTGAELLKITRQSSPAVVKMTCLYLYGYQSPQSETSSLIIRTSLPPSLTVNPPVIDETDSVALNCQPPSSVSVPQCYFHTLGGGSGRVRSCLQTLTGSELLRMSYQSSPTTIKLTCFYTEKLGEEDSPSPHSAVSSITIHRLTPKLSRLFDGDLVLFTCSLPGSSAYGTKCNLYFGEASRPAKTADILSKSAKKESFCQFFFPVAGLLNQLRSVKQRDASCDYTLGSGSLRLSPRSDRYSMMDLVEEESSVTQTMSAFTMTTAGLTVSPPSNTVRVASTLKISATPSVTDMTSLNTDAEDGTAGLTVSPPSNTVRVASTLKISATPSVTDMTSLNTDAEDGTGVSVNMPDSKDSTVYETSEKTASERGIWKFVAVTAGCGVTVGVLLLVSAVLCNQRRAGENVDCLYRNLVGHRGLLPACKDETYSVITYVKGADIQDLNNEQGTDKK